MPGLDVSAGPSLVSRRKTRAVCRRGSSWADISGDVEAEAEYGSPLLSPEDRCRADLDVVQVDDLSCLCELVKGLARANSQSYNVRAFRHVRPSGRDTTRLRTRAIDDLAIARCVEVAIGSVAVEAIRRAPEACSLCWLRWYAVKALNPRPTARPARRIARSASGGGVD